MVEEKDCGRCGEQIVSGLEVGWFTMGRGYAEEHEMIRRLYFADELSRP